MKFTTFLLSYALLISFTNGQFFVQQLEQVQIQNPEDFYVVTADNDTINGKLSNCVFTDSLINRVTVKVGDEKIKLSLEQIQTIALIPNEAANYEDIALLPVLKGIKNGEFIEALPEDGWVFYEKIRLPGKRERYAMAQLLNPGFDSKLKVYAHPEASDNGSSSLNGITLRGAQDDKHYVSVNQGAPFVIGIFQYRKKALESLYSNCSELKDQKLKWKDFAKHVFTFDQKCE